ncbi:MAG TPA: SLC13 family permease, partial [Pseudacidobacterium sp.]|nr:SLC13 family permease [Pseudacidobacterium sp.]
MTFLAWGISLASIALMLIRPKGISEYIWVCGAAILLIITGLLPLKNAAHAIYEGLDVYLFLTGMMLLAEMARYEGVFGWVADIAVHHANGSAAKLFLLIYLAGTIVTVLLSNDATAVVLTPAVLAAVRRANVEPRPYLLTCAFIANTASFVLPISNPANLVIFGEKLPALAPWLHMFLLPSFVSIVVTFLCLRFMERKDLRGTVEAVAERVNLTAGGRITLAGIAIAAGVLLTASAFGISLGAPTFAVGVLALVLLAFRDRQAPTKIIKGISWSVLPLVAGLFMIVEALNRAGMLRLTLKGFSWLAQSPDDYGKFIAGGAVALVSNIMNNLPVALASGTAL